MRHLLLLVLILLLLPAMASASITVEGALTTAISERQAVDQVTELPPDVTRLYCFTRILGGGEAGTVVHVWYWGDREMARVELPVRSDDWRTWSSKNVLPEWHGTWRVEVLDAAGTLLQSFAFQVP